MQEARWRFVTSTDLDATPETVFSILLDDDAWHIWHPEISDINWDNYQPHGVGSHRTVRFSNWLFMILLCGSLILSEEFLIWENNKRLNFRFNKTNRPRFMGYLAGMEDFQIEDLGNGKCRLCRTVAVDPSFITSVLGCILKPVLQGIFDRAAQSLAQKVTNKEFSRPINV
jgi:hypothetical protein